MGLAISKGKRYCPVCGSGKFYTIPNYDAMECQTCGLIISGPQLEELIPSRPVEVEDLSPQHVGEAKIRPPLELGPGDGRIQEADDSDEYGVDG